MPELPEVGALAEFLRERVIAARIAKIELAAIAALKTYDPPVTAIEGREVAGVRRFGKFLCLTFTGDDLHLVIHLARAGWLRWRDGTGPPVRTVRGPLAARLTFVDSDGQVIGGFDLTEAGTQKSLAIYVVTDPKSVPGIARLGPDPLSPEFTVELLAGILTDAGRTQLKGILRDQTLIAGVGNAYSDEILHVARLSPFKPANSLVAEGVGDLHTAIVTTLTEATARAHGVAAKELKAEKKEGLRVHGRTGQPCPVCGATICEVSLSDRNFQYCPDCQTGGKVLADRRLSRLLK